MSGLLQGVGLLLGFLGFVGGVVGCLGAINHTIPHKPEDVLTTFSAWAMFLGGCVLFGTGAVIDRLGPPSP